MWPFRRRVRLPNVPVATLRIKDGDMLIIPRDTPVQAQENLARDLRAAGYQRLIVWAAGSSTDAGGES